jgi:Na+/pantothenate symporter
MLQALLAAIVSPDDAVLVFFSLSMIKDLMMAWF